MAEKKGCCGGGTSQEPCGGTHKDESCGCGGLQLEVYWCETCRRSVAEKRCPLCGQKTRRSRPG